MRDIYMPLRLHYNATHLPTSPNSNLDPTSTCRGWDLYVSPSVHPHHLLILQKCSDITIAEILGYICRILSAKQAPNHTVALFIVQGCPTLLAPALFAATIYMCLGRIIKLTDGAHLSLIPLSILTRLFVGGDIMGLLIQGAGMSPFFLSPSVR